MEVFAVQKMFVQIPPLPKYHRTQTQETTQN